MLPVSRRGKLGQCTFLLLFAVVVVAADGDAAALHIA